MTEVVQRRGMLRVVVSMKMMGYERSGEESGVFALVLVRVTRYMADGGRMRRRAVSRVHQRGHWRDGIHRVRERRPDAFPSADRR